MTGSTSGGVNFKKIMTNHPQKFYLTPEGLAKLRKEYEELKNKKRPAAVERLSRAREFGDLTENSEYFSAREDLMFIDDRITELENILKKTTIIKAPQKNGVIQLGSTVVVEMGGEINEFTVVGTFEVNPTENKISNESPIGQALLGKSVGNSVDVKTPIVSYSCKILEVK